MDSLELDRSKGSLLPHTVVSAKQNVYFFSPVHFREREIGYLVLENCDYLLDHQFLFETLNTFRTSIEALYGKLILRKKNKQLSQLYIHDSSTTVWLMKSLPFRSFNNICRKADLSESCSQMQII